MRSKPNTVIDFCRTVVSIADKPLNKLDRNIVVRLSGDKTLPEGGAAFHQIKITATLYDEPLPITQTLMPTRSEIECGEFNYQHANSLVEYVIEAYFKSEQFKARLLATASQQIETAMRAMRESLPAVSKFAEPFRF